MQSIDEMPHVLGDDGQFHAQDDEVDLSGTPVEGWIALGLFWTLGLTVFYQFVTRYVLNDSAAWTEEISRYFLVATVFIGASIGVAKNNHIQVDFFYRYLPHGVSRMLATAVDILRIAFFATTIVLTIEMMMKLGQTARMTIVDLPMNIVYGVCLFGFGAMFLRSLWVARIHWRRGYTVLERVESTMQDGAELAPEPQPLKA